MQTADQLDHAGRALSAASDYCAAAAEIQAQVIACGLLSARN
ncbi:MAG: hypothetical protein QNJ84_10230 [Alphaproteobacteria bacterium]|nr:hypothetical protein [Alphaproteobacteria bacterium]